MEIEAKKILLHKLHLITREKKHDRRLIENK